MSELARERKPGWYRGGDSGAAPNPHGMWQWWDGQTWKALEPGDETAGNQAYNRKATNVILAVTSVLVLAGLVWGAASNAIGQ